LLARNITEKMMTYATGRSMSLRDEEEIKQIATIANHSESGFRDLILEIATSKIFTRR